MFLAPAGSRSEKEAQEKALRSTDVAQPALGAVALGALKVLESFGVKADALRRAFLRRTGGLYAAGRYDEATLAFVVGHCAAV